MKVDFPDIKEHDLKTLREDLIPQFLSTVKTNSSVVLKVVAREGRITGTKMEIDNPWPSE